MSENRTFAPARALTAAEYAELVRELDELRSRHRRELAQRLRHARDFGSRADDDDRLTVFEDAAIDEARITRLEQLVRASSVVAASAGDGAGPGSTVRVADEAGETIVYELVGRCTANSTSGQVSLGSPVGQALAGVRPGDVARVALPSGRQRALRVLDVTSPPGAGARAA